MFEVRKSPNNLGTFCHVDKQRRVA
jgi:hypothetical protein